MLSPSGLLSPASRAQPVHCLFELLPHRLSGHTWEVQAPGWEQVQREAGMVTCFQPSPPRQELGDRQGVPELHIPLLLHVLGLPGWAAAKQQHKGQQGVESIMESRVKAA